MGDLILKRKQKTHDFFYDWELATWVLLILVYGTWVAITLLMPQLPTLLVFLLGGGVVCLHGSLQHEAVHGHPTPSEWLNTLAVAIPLSLWIPYTRYRELHQAHHKADLTDPLQDPESFYVTQKQWQARAPWRRLILMANQTLVGRLCIGPLLTIWRFWSAEFRLIVAGDTRVLSHWLAHLAGVGVVLYWVLTICGMSIISYVVLFVYPGLAFTLLRSYTEHRPGEDNWRRTAIVEGSWLTQLMFLNNNFHLVHHKHPGLPWYRIAKAYKENKHYWLGLNDHFVYPSYWSVARRFGLSPKDHPVRPA